MATSAMGSTHPSEVESQRMAARLDAAGWGAFFLWVGTALTANLDWGIGLLGVGLITLGGQAARKRFDIPVEGFWLVVGLLFSLGGIWEIFNVEFEFGPVLLVIVGLGLLLSALRR